MFFCLYFYDRDCKEDYSRFKSIQTDDDDSIETDSVLYIDFRQTIRNKIQNVQGWYLKRLWDQTGGICTNQTWYKIWKKWAYDQLD